MLNRLITFKNFSLLAPVRPPELARDGFEHSGNPHDDEITCSGCTFKLSNLISRRDITDKHSRNNPSCRFLSERTSLTGNNDFSGAASSFETEKNILIKVMQKSEEYRLATFSLSGEHVQFQVPVENLIENGFFYLGPQDRVKCAFCEVNLSSWESGDDVKSKHAKISPHCSFLNLNKVRDETIRVKKLRNAFVPYTFEDRERMENKLRELQEDKKCKVCMDAKKTTIFLPCGHFVACATCAAVLRNCCVCRTHIRGTAAVHDNEPFSDSVYLSGL